MRGSFLTYRKYLWRKISLGTAIILIVLYNICGTSSPNGGTVLGFIYGVIGSIAILFLMFYFFRKRWYRFMAYGTLQAWLSFHFYVGLLTLFIIPMHAGLRLKFDFDIHTLAFVLMALVVLSGLVGAYLYLSIPKQFSKFDKELPYAGEDSIDNALNASIGNILEFCESKSHVKQLCDKEMRRSLPTKYAGWRTIFRRPAMSTIPSIQAEYEEDRQSMSMSIPDDDFDRFVTLTKQKRDLEYRFVSQMRLRNLLESWLYFHLPMSIAMMVAIVAHIVLVFYYGYRLF